MITLVKAKLLPRIAVQEMSIGGICFHNCHDVHGKSTVRGISR
ncbi:MAG: hypothetical protein WBN68_22025 [Sedimenticolaceae bacterium]